MKMLDVCLRKTLSESFAFDLQRGRTFLRRELITRAQTEESNQRLVDSGAVSSRAALTDGNRTCCKWEPCAAF